MTIEIIAEIGQNHNGDMQLACELIKAAYDAGADVAKFQLYDAPSLFSSENNPWYEYNCKTELSRDDVVTLSLYCQTLGIEFMASVFDQERIAWLEKVGVSRYKIASRSIYDSSLIAALLATGKPLIASLGMWDSPDFPSISNNDSIDYLYCISKYPTPISDLRFAEVDFSKYSGFSDHTETIYPSQIAMARGASIIEKHFTLDKNMYGPDHSCSMTPSELVELCNFRDCLLQVI